eukprot:1147408-Pelagomonas_calceolata.AAC.1
MYANELVTIRHAIENKNTSYSQGKLPLPHIVLFLFSSLLSSLISLPNELCWGRPALEAEKMRDSDQLLLSRDLDRIQASPGFTRGKSVILTAFPLGPEN